MTPETLLLLLFLSVLGANLVTVPVQWWYQRRAVGREMSTGPRGVFAVEPPSFTDEELEEQLRSERRARDLFMRNDERRQAATARLIKRGDLPADWGQRPLFGCRHAAAIDPG